MRLSNMELLRIIAMFMVMVFHCNFHTMSHPTFEMVAQNPLESYMAFVVQAISVMCVNVFILLSGWFGIRPSIKSFSRLIFQIIFFLWGSYAIALLQGKESLSIGFVAHMFCMDKGGWFIKAYVCLYILAPVLNSFADTVEKSSFKKLLIAFFVFQCLYGWVTNAAEFIQYGFSTISFIGLYLLAKYIRRFSPSWSTCNRRLDLTMYLLLVFGSAAVCLIAGCFPQIGSLFHSIVGHMYAYTSPVVILMCVLILLYFSKLSFQSKAINYVAASSFAVILVHGNPHIFPYTDRVINAYASYGYWGGLGFVTIMNVCVFFAAILLDQIRIVCWKLFTSKHLSCLR